MTPMGEPFSLRERRPLITVCVILRSEGKAKRESGQRAIVRCDTILVEKLGQPAPLSRWTVFPQ